MVIKSQFFIFSVVRAIGRRRRNPFQHTVHRKREAQVRRHRRRRRRLTPLQDEAVRLFSSQAFRLPDASLEYCVNCQKHCSGFRMAGEGPGKALGGRWVTRPVL